MEKRTFRLGLIFSACLAAMPAAAENLLDVYLLAERNDPQLASAEANYHAALEAKPQSRAGILPSVNLSANWSRNQSDTTYTDPAFAFRSGDSTFNNYGYTLSLSQPLYRKANFLALEQADVGIKQAEANFAAAQQDLMLRTASAYFAVLAAQDNLHFARAEKVAIARQLEQTKQRFEVGLTAITDVHEAQARYDLVRAQEIAAEFEVENTREQLRQITAQNPDNLATLRKESPLASPEPADIEAWTKRALEQNLGLQAVRQATELAALNVQTQRSGHHPTLDLVASHQDSTTEGGALPNESTGNSIGLQFNLPLYSGGATNSAISQARFQLTASEKSQEQQQRSVEALARNSYRGVTASIVRVQALRQAVVSNRSALDATEAGYEVGTRTSVDVLDARRNLFGAQRDFSQARYDYITNTLRLKQAAGMLSQDDLQQVNAWLE